MAMYIRVKRRKTTYFLTCDATETILDIKQKLYDLIDQPVNDQCLTLMATGNVLDDSKTLADQKVENDAVVALTLRKDDNEFEQADFVTVKADIGLAVDVMQIMESSIHTLLSRVEGVNCLISELADCSITRKRAMVDDCEALLAITAAMQLRTITVKEYSLRTLLVQLKQTRGG